MKKFSNILWGLLFILLGVVIGLNSFGITNINLFFDGWWTLLLIIPCTIELFRSKYKVVNLIGIATGVALLLFCQDILSFDILWKLALPTILILLGLALVFKDVLFGRKNANFKRSEDKIGKEDIHHTTLGSKKINYDGQTFLGNDLTAVAGNITCDLRNAFIEEDVIINATAALGRVDIIVPQSVNVEIKSTALFGGVVDRRRTGDVLVNAPTIYVSGLCLLGSVEIK